MAGISRKALLDALATHLKTTPRPPALTVYRGEVDPAPPVITTSTGLDPAGRVAPYAVIYPSPGTPAADGDLADTHEDLEWLVQVTVAAGFLDDLMDVVDVIDERMHLWAPTIDGTACTGLLPPAGYDPGPARRDDDVRPPRFYVPLAYRLTATR